MAVHIRVLAIPLFFMSDENIIQVTDKKFIEMADELYHQIIPIKDKFEWIVSIRRGGEPLGNWLSIALEKLHTCIEISLYGNDKTKKDVTPHIWLGPHYKKYVTTQFLLVDDICDSGSTIKLFRDLVAKDGAKFWIATLHWCEENSPDCRPDFFVEKKLKTSWVVYPWEKV
jgi:hypoxanthine phosphoribosyltransferase